MHIMLITGMSGSGKSVAIDALEDAGYYCVDNLPPHFLPELVDFLARCSHTRLAVAIDARSGHPLSNLPSLITALRTQHDVKVLFLEASTQTLIQRFSETRRRHPLFPVHSGHASLTQAIEHERALLCELATLGHVIDTSKLRANALRVWVTRFASQKEYAGLILTLESFAFKHGIPLDADFVFDLRPLPNPYYDPALRPLNGLDLPVADFLHAVPEVCAMLEDIETFLRKWLPHFQQDNRSYLTVALGCTGGQHRSVYCAQTLAARLAQDAQVMVRHRELGDS